MSVVLMGFPKTYIEPLAGSLAWRSFSGVLTSVLTVVVSVIVYRLYLHPLAHIPGPVIARVTSLWLFREAYRGTEASTLEALHKKYGKVVRIGPNEVDVNDGTALHLIYVKNGGFEKNPCYTNLDIDDIPTIFSDTSNAHRAARAKVVASMFSQQAIRNGCEAVLACVDKMADKLEREIKHAAGKPVDVLSIFRSMGLDSATAYLFRKPFGALDANDFSVSDTVDFNIASGKWFYLPNPVFKALEVLRATFEANWGAKVDRVRKALIIADKYTAQLIDDTVKVEGDKDENSYQARLLRAGIPRQEVIAQCKDIMAAGTDTTAMNLATIVFRLTRNPKKYDRLRREVLENPGADPQTLPYLSATVKEGLRLSMVTPTRFPRIVGPSGLHVLGMPPIPPGTSVGACVWCMHLNPSVYVEPHAFEPERWLRPSDEMQRDLIPFGAGPRQCIARNLAMATLHWALRPLVQRDLLKGARTVRDQIEIKQWFMAQVMPDGRIELVWRDLR